MVDKRIEKVLISKTKIKRATKKAAQWINKEYANKNLVLVTILKGSIPFVGALIPLIKVDFEIDYIAISSFKGKTTAQSLPELVMNFCNNLKGKDVLLVEDIIDSGRTIKEIIRLLKTHNAKSVKILTLLDKPSGRKVEIEADYKCFTIPKCFIVGFGLDYEEKLRNLPYVGILKKEYIKGE